MDVLRIIYHKTPAALNKHHTQVPAQPLARVLIQVQAQLVAPDKPLNKTKLILIQTYEQIYHQFQS